MEAYDELASGAPSWYGGILTLLGRGKNDEALRQAREKETISKENTDKVGQLAALRLKTKAQLAKGDSWNAKTTAEEAVTLAKSSGDKKASAGATHMFAKAQLKAGDLNDAMATAKEAEASFKSLSFQAGVAAVMSTISSIHSAKKEQDQALETANAAVQIFKELGELSGQASALKVSVDMKMSENRYYHALILVEEMVKLYNEASDAEGEAAANLLASELQVEQGDLQNAMDRASASAELFNQLGDSKRQGAAVLCMARAFEGAGQVQDATQAAEAAVSLYQDGRDKRGQAAALLILGSTLCAQKQFGTAAYRLEEAAFVFRQLKDKKQEASAMASVASTQLQMMANPFDMPIQGFGDEVKEQAVKNAARAVELFGELGAQNSSECGNAILSQAKVLNILTRHDEAIAKAGEAQTLFQNIDNKGGQAAALTVIADAYTGKKSFDAAMEALEKSRELAEEDDGEGLSLKEVSNKIKEIGKYKALSKRPASEGGRIDIQIIRADVPILEYSAYEGRSMRTGPAPKSSSSLQPGDPNYIVPARQKVLYNLRMQRVQNVDMTAGSSPQAILA